MASIGRTPALRLAGWLVKTPRVALAAVLWMFAIEAAGGLAAWVILTVVIAGTLASVLAEPVMVKVLWWAWRSAPIGIPGVPEERVLVTSRRTPGIELAGRRHLIVAPALVGRSDVTQLLAQAHRVQLVAATRFDVAYQWFTLPWQVLAGFGHGAAQRGSRIPPIRFAWKVRLVVTGIAIWQSVAAGRCAAAVGVVVVIGLTYLLPWTHRHQVRLIDQALAGASGVPGVADRAAAPLPPVLARTATAAPAARRPATHAPRDARHPGHQHRQHRLISGSSRQQ